MNLVWRRKRKHKEIERFACERSFGETRASRNPGPCRLGREYPAYVKNAKEPAQGGQLFWIRVALLEEPFLDMVANLSSSQIPKNFTPLKDGDFVLWTPLQHLPEQGRVMNMSTDPRADYMGYISAQIDKGMILETRELSILQQFPLGSK